jgi:hypothetical protein
MQIVNKTKKVYLPGSAHRTNCPQVFPASLIYIAWLHQVSLLRSEMVYLFPVSLLQPIPLLTNTILNNVSAIFFWLDHHACPSQIFPAIDLKQTKVNNICVYEKRKQLKLADSQQLC